MKKLMLVGSNSVHVYNYLDLVGGYFDEVMLITDEKKEGVEVETKVLDFHLKKFTVARTTIGAIKQCIAEFRPSVIHIHQANSYALYALKAAKNSGVPTVLTAWGSDVLLLPKRNWLMKRMVCKNLRDATVLTADAQFVSGEMRRLVPGKKLEIVVANFGIEINEEKRIKENIIYSNRLHKKLYRVDKVIEGFARFLQHATDKNWKLIVAAIGEETETLKTLTEKLALSHCVEFVGWVNKTQNVEFYSRARIFVSVPESDATAISLLEAMAYGCIPVLSDLPANNEWVTDGTNGIIVRSFDEDFIGRALKLDADEVRRINTSIINEKGTKEANRRKFIDIYDRLLNKIK